MLRPTSSFLPKVLSAFPPSLDVLILSCVVSVQSREISPYCLHGIRALRVSDAAYFRYNGSLMSFFMNPLSLFTRSLRWTLQPQLMPALCVRSFWAAGSYMWLPWDCYCVFLCFSVLPTLSLNALDFPKVKVFLCYWEGTWEFCFMPKLRHARRGRGLSWAGLPFFASV